MNKAIQTKVNYSRKTFLLLLFLFLISFTSSLSLGTYKQNEVVRITQVCSDATYINISSIAYPDSSVAVSGISMISAGSGEFYYDFNDTLRLGRYDVRGISDGCEKTFATYFEINPSGRTGDNSNIFFFLFVILLIYGITFTGFFGRNIPITILGGMAMIFLGVYMVNHGIIIYQDNLTNYLAYLTIAIGFITAIWAGIEQLDIL